MSQSGPSRFPPCIAICSRPRRRNSTRSVNGAGKHVAGRRSGSSRGLYRLPTSRPPGSPRSNALRVQSSRIRAAACKMQLSSPHGERKNRDIDFGGGEERQGQAPLLPEAKASHQVVEIVRCWSDCTVSDQPRYKSKRAVPRPGKQRRTTHWRPTATFSLVRAPRATRCTRAPTPGASSW